MKSVNPQLANLYVNLHSCSDYIQCLPNKDCMRAVH